ncbi:MAG: hypothetical protein F4X20_01495 [Dehalococcoidia bacterium]|nr:hypothetical protein [Dehalococcoidia bacterium]
MRFLVDRCAGRRLAEWLRSEGHDVFEAIQVNPDPGDQALLELAATQNRVFITIDTDFGELIFLHGVAHAGLVRLPDVPSERRIELMTEIITRYSTQLEERAIITVTGNRIRITPSTVN